MMYLKSALKINYATIGGLVWILVILRAMASVETPTLSPNAATAFRDKLNETVTAFISSPGLSEMLSQLLKESYCKSIQLSSWDSRTAVFLKAGPDQAPGAAHVDDDGNGVVDDASELGATGTDDVIVTPADREAYELAASNPAARVVSHGAMIPIWSSDSSLSLSSAMEQLPTPAELRIDAVDQQGKLHSRFISLR